MTFREKELLLEHYHSLDTLNQEQLEIIEHFAEDEEELIRSGVAKLLIDYQDENSKRILLKLVGDEEELVRIEAYDSLSYFDTRDVEETLKKAIRTERKSLACSYAIMTWAEVVVARRTILWEPYWFITNFKKKQRIQKSEQCLLECCYAQYLFGKKRALKEILHFLKSDDYHIRCATINALGRIVDEKNKWVIQKVLQALLVKGDFRAVTSTAESVLKEMFGG